MYGLNILYYIDIMEECKEIAQTNIQSESNVKKTLNDYISSKQYALKTLHELEAEELNANKRSVTLLEHAKEIYPLISEINKDTLQYAIQSALADAEKKTDEEENALVLKNIALQVNADAQVKATEIAKALNKAGADEKAKLEEKVEAQAKVVEAQAMVVEEAQAKVVEAQAKVAKLEIDIRDAKAMVTKLEKSIKLARLDVTNATKAKETAKSNTNPVEQKMGNENVKTRLEKEVAQLNAVKLATAVELENANLKAINAQYEKNKSEQVAINLQQILVTYNQNTEKKQNLQEEIDSLNKTLEKNKRAKVTAENELKGEIASFVKCINTFNITEINAIPVDLYTNNIDHMRIIVDRLKQILENTETVPLGRQSPSTSAKMLRGDALDEDKQTIEDILNTFTTILEKIVKDPNDAAELSIAVATAEALDKGENVDKAADDAFNKVRADAKSLIDHIKTIDRKLTKSLKSLTKVPEVEPTVDTTDMRSSTQEDLYSDKEESLNAMTPKLYINLYSHYKNSHILKKETIQKYIQKFNDQYNQEYDTYKEDSIRNHITEIIESGLYEILYEQLKKVDETNENLMNSIKQYSSMYYILNFTNRAFEEPTYYCKNKIKHMLWNTHNGRLLYYNQWIKYFIRHISTQRGNFYFNIQHINTTEDKLEKIFSTTQNIEFHLITSDEYKNGSSGFNNVIFSNHDSSINIKIEEPTTDNHKDDRADFQYTDSMLNLRKKSCIKYNTDNQVEPCEKDSGKCYKRCIFIKKDGTPVCTDPNKQIYFYIYSGKNNRIDIEKSVLVIQANNCKRVVKTKISIVKDVNSGGRSFMKKSKTTRNKITRLSRRKTGGSVRNNYRRNNSKSTINKNKRRN